VPSRTWFGHGLDRSWTTPFCITLMHTYWTLRSLCNGTLCPHKIQHMRHSRVFLHLAHAHILAPRARALSCAFTPCTCATSCASHIPLCDNSYTHTLIAQQPEHCTCIAHATLMRILTPCMRALSCAFAPCAHLPNILRFMYTIAQ
jgi:hypothetical protein